MTAVAIGRQNKTTRAGFVACRDGLDTGGQDQNGPPMFHILVDSVRVGIQTPIAIYDGRPTAISGASQRHWRLRELVQHQAPINRRPDEPTRDPVIRRHGLVV